MSILVDVHCHLDHPAFKDLDAVIDRAKKTGLKSIVTAGVDADSNRRVLEISKRYDIVKASLGIYPISVLQKEKEIYNLPHAGFDADQEIEFIRKNKDNLVFIGEIGMDFALVKDSSQQELFLKMIELAESIKKPIIVHSRKAEKEVIDVIESSKIKKVIMHCFSGNLSLVKKIEDNGWFISIPPNIVRSSHFQEIVKKVNINQLLTETDAPFLAPEKDGRNEPSNVLFAVKKIAELKGMDALEVQNNIFMNYNKLI